MNRYKKVRTKYRLCEILSDGRRLNHVSASSLTNGIEKMNYHKHHFPQRKWCVVKEQVIVTEVARTN